MNVGLSVAIKSLNASRVQTHPTPDTILPVSLIRLSHHITRRSRRTEVKFRDIIRLHIKPVIPALSGDEIASAPYIVVVRAGLILTVKVFVHHWTFTPVASIGPHARRLPK